MFRLTLRRYGVDLSFTDVVCTEHLKTIAVAAERGGPTSQYGTVSENGCRATWRVVGPQIGNAYVGVVFGENGVEQWQKRLEATSLTARMRRLFDPLIPA